MQFKSFIEDPQYRNQQDLQLTLIRTFGKVGPHSEPLFRDKGIQDVFMKHVSAFFISSSRLPPVFLPSSLPNSLPRSFLISSLLPFLSSTFPCHSFPSLSPSLPPPFFHSFHSSLLSSLSFLRHSFPLSILPTVIVTHNHLYIVLSISSTYSLSSQH